VTARDGVDEIDEREEREGESTLTRSRRSKLEGGMVMMRSTSGRRGRM